MRKPSRWVWPAAAPSRCSSSASMERCPLAARALVREAAAARWPPWWPVPGIGACGAAGCGGCVIAGSLPCRDRRRCRLPMRCDLADTEQAVTLTYGEHEVFVETVAPPPRLVIWGADEVAIALSSMAKKAGFRVTVCDPRPAFTLPERFPDRRRGRGGLARRCRRPGADRRPHLRGVADPRRPGGGSAAPRRAGVPCQVHRCHGEPPYPCQAHRATGGGRVGRGEPGAHPRPGRPRHRCRTARRGSSLDPRRDDPAPVTGREPARRCEGARAASTGSEPERQTSDHEDPG